MMVWLARYNMERAETRMIRQYLAQTGVRDALFRRVRGFYCSAGHVTILTSVVTLPGFPLSTMLMRAWQG